MPKKTKAIVPLFSNQKQGLLILKAGLEIGPTPDEQAQDIYKSDYVLSLEEEIKSLSQTKELINDLKAFRELLSGHCFQTDGPITIIHCSELWKANKCRYEECKTRKSWIELFPT